MTKIKVITSAFSNLYTDQRIEKACRTLHENGYEVNLIGNNWNGAEEMVRPYSFFRIKLISKSLKTAYFEFNWKLYKELKKSADKNTILYANDVDALLPNYLIAKKLNIPLVFDSHELFSEMPAIQGKISQKIWRYLERKIIPEIKFMITASEGYGKWFHRKYGVNPVVVQNSPRKFDVTGNISENDPKIIIYQGFINPFRGIEKAILAMHYLDNVIFKIAGSGPKEKEYQNLVVKENLQHKVLFIGKFKPENLRKITSVADCGMSIEENEGESYFYSLPNKVLDCIQARVPVILCSHPELLSIKRKYDVGEIIKDHNPESIAEAIKMVLNKGKKNYRTELDKAADEFCWEKEEIKLIEVFKKAAGVL